MTNDQFTKFVIILTSVPGAQSNEALIRDHVRFLKKLDAEKKLVLCGPFSDYAGGMIIINAQDKIEAEAIARLDPFVTSGARTFEVRTWNISCDENNHLGMGG